MKIHHDLQFVANALEVVGPSTYLSLGETRDTGTEPLAKLLHGELYGRFYCRRTAIPPESDVTIIRDFTEQLSAANCGSGSWEAGWRIVRVEENRVVVRREDICFWTPPNMVRTPARDLRAGDACRVRIGKEFRQLAPGFYIANGNGSDRELHPELRALVRIYWNLTAGAAAPFIASVTRRLNEARVPFRAKVLYDPQQYARADSGVLYVEVSRFAAAKHLLRAVHEDVAPLLGNDTPLFTKRVAPGVGVAEDPGKTAESFGSSRCALIANALCEAFARGARTAPARLRAIEAAFLREGLDPARPWLQRAARDAYRFTAAV